MRELMEKLIDKADIYCKQSNWKDMALLKFCLCSIGVIIGLSMPKEKKKAPLVIAIIVFLVTYIPLMNKFIKIFLDDEV